MKKYKIYSQEQEVSTVDDAIVTYLRSFPGNLGLEISNKEFRFLDFLEDKMLVIQAIRKGLPFRLFSKIMDITPFTESDWADYLGLSQKTLQRHRKDKDYFFKPIHSEKIIELAEVAIIGREVFDTVEQFYLWLQTPSMALNNEKPAELLKDSYGKELVMAELNRIEYGIFA